MCRVCMRGSKLPSPVGVGPTNQNYYITAIVWCEGLILYMFWVINTVDNFETPADGLSSSDAVSQSKSELINCNYNFLIFIILTEILNKIKNRTIITIVL